MTYEELKEMSENEERLKRTLLDGALQDNYAPPHQKLTEDMGKRMAEIADKEAKEAWTGSPHQREKEMYERIIDEIEIETEEKGTYTYRFELNPFKLAKQMGILESRLDDLYSVLKPSQRIQIEQHKTPL